MDFTWQMCRVVQEAVHDDTGNQLQLARQASGWRTRLGLGKTEGSSGPLERILQLDVASKAVNTIMKEAIKDTYQVFACPCWLTLPPLSAAFAPKIAPKMGISVDDVLLGSLEIQQNEASWQEFLSRHVTHSMFRPCIALVSLRYLSLSFFV